MICHPDELYDSPVTNQCRISHETSDSSDLFQSANLTMFDHNKMARDAASKTNLPGSTHT